MSREACSTDCALIRGDTVEAEKRYLESLQAALQLGDLIETSFEVQGVAMAVAGNGHPERGLRLAASVEALRESLGHLRRVRIRRRRRVQVPSRVRRVSGRAGARDQVILDSV